MNGSGKHSSLLRYGNNNDSKSFIVQGCQPFLTVKQNKLDCL
jgi:hypothetical protein